jgi:lipopolysaccharide export system permease protein
MPGILSRYIFRETMQTWLAVTATLLLILVTNQFAQVLGDAAAGKLPKEAVFLVMSLTTVQFLTILIPVSLFLSVMMALARLYRDSEMTAITACGVGPVSLYRPLLLIALVLGGVVAWLALDVAPSAMRQVQLIGERARQAADITMLEPGQFLSFSNGEAVIYAESQPEPGQLANVFVQRRDGEDVEVIVARHAEQSSDEESGAKVLVFRDGRRYEGRPGAIDFQILEFEEHGIPLEVPSAGAIEPDTESRALDELLERSDNEAAAEIQWRLAAPVSLVVLTLLAVPLARSSPRAGRFSKVAAGVLLYIIYANLLGIGRVWLERGDVPYAVGMWWVHGIFVCLAIGLLMQHYGIFSRLLPRRATSA